MNPSPFFIELIVYCTRTYMNIYRVIGADRHLQKEKMRKK